jgi:hypothetical protein
MAALGCRLALPLAAFVLAALGDLSAFLLILASDMQLAFDVSLRIRLVLNGGMISVTARGLVSKSILLALPLRGQRGL